MKNKFVILAAFFCMGLANNGVSQSLESSKDLYYQDGFLLNQPIIINFSDGPGNAKDWIGIYDGERLPGDGAGLVWSYVDGTDVGNTGKKSGTVQYDKVLKPGPYKAYFLENNSYNIIATTSFVVTDDEDDLEPELPEGVYFEENFDGVTLGPFESDSESDGDGTDWASQGPAGWVMRKNNGHGLTGGGDDVVEFDGWTFFDPVSWNATAGQNRSNFTKGTGVIAVADSDEYDDKDDAKLNVSLSTPSIDISDASGSKLILKYDSSWRKEPHIGSVSVSYDGVGKIELLKLDGNSPDAYNDMVELELNNPAGAKSVVISWNYEGYNNWWWAIDNISVYEKVVENTAPVVSGQSLSVNEDETMSITLQGSDEDKDDLNFTVLNQPKNGTLSGAGQNLTYTPKANFHGSDSFTFKATDGISDSNTATVSIKVDSVNDKPVVSGQSVSIKEDETVSITLQGSDEDKDDLTFIVLNQPKNGTLSGASPNLTYTPKANFHGSDSFMFKANDGVTDSNTATVSIKVDSVNDKPVVSGQSLSVNEDETVSITLQGSDEDKDDLTFTVLNKPKNGTLSGTGPNLTYTPKANYYGSDIFTFKANDGVTDSNTVTVSIKVDSVNDKPVVSGQSVSIKEDETVSITLQGSDEDKNDLTFTVLNQSKNGALSGTGPNLTYTPKANFHGSDSFTFKANDSVTDSNTATVSIKVDSVNDKPVVSGQSLSVNEDETVSITLQGSDVDKDDLNFTVLNEPKNGALSGTGPNLTYTPKANFHGSDSFTFNANDGVSDSNTATILININKAIEPQLNLTKNIYKSGEKIVVSFAYGPGNKKDWFGIYKKKNNPREDRSEAWIYVDGTENGILGVKSGQITFENLSLKVGKYDIFLFENNTSEVILSAASFEIVESPIISVDNNLTENIDIELSFKKGPGNKNNWIGIWPSNENPQDSFSKTWLYVDGTKNGLQTQTEGVLNLGKLSPGSYNAYFINNNNKDKILASIEFNVSVEVPKWNKTPKGKYLHIARKESRPVLTAMLNDNSGNSGDEFEVRLNFKHINGNPSIYLMSNSVILGQLTLFPDGLVKVFNGEWITLKQKYQINKWNELIVNYKNSSQSGVISINNTDSEIVLMNKNSTSDIKHLNAIQLQTDGKDTEFNVDNVQVVEITKGKELFFDDFSNATIEKSPINPQKGNWKWNQLSIVKVLPNDINKKKWTIMVYNQGDNNLAYFSLIQNKVFDAIGSNEDVNIIIQTDYDTSDKRLMNNIHNYDDNPDNITEGVTRIIIGKNEKKIDLSNYGYSFKASRNTVIEKRFPENSKYENRMDDPKFFGEFLDWGFSDFPAERYGIFFVDHGGSWSGGFGGDHQDGLGGAQGIKPKAFRREIKSAFTKNKIEKFDFIKFYACLMGTAEVLDAFSDLCEVFIANPEITMLGQNNHEGRAKFISYLLDNPDTSNINLAKYEVKEWFNNFSYERWGGVHCAYDMTKYSAFKTAFESFSKALTHEAKNKNSLIAAARINTWPYNLHSVYNIKKPTRYIDLAHFAEILSLSANGDLKIQSTQLLDAINKMVIDKFLGTKRPDSSSLNITYPVKGYNKNWVYNYHKTYFANGHTKDYTGWAGVPSSWSLKGTGGEWIRFLNEVNTLSQESGKIEYVINDAGALVPSRNSEFGNAENDIIIGSATKSVEIDFEVNNPNNANDYRINIVSNKETNNPNQFIYLGEIYRGKINKKDKHSFLWDGKIPILSLGSDGSKAPPVGSIDINRKELIGEIPLYLGGWFSDLSEDTMISYADYLGPNDIKKTSVILISKFIDGYGEIETIILDSGSENKGVAPVPVDITFEKGGKLWPLYYMEEPDPGNPNGWMPYYVWFKDGYINIPDNGKDGIIIDWVTVEKGDYRAEVEVSDNFGVYNEPLKFDIRVEGDLNSLPGLVITLEGERVVLSWGMEDRGDEAILQWANGLGGEWVDVPSSNLGFGGAGRLYKESAREESRFYRLIKR